MSRRIALALSFSLTVVVTFALVSLASQAGWLEAKSGDHAQVAAIEPEPPATLEPTIQPEPRVITEYIYVDVPAVSQPAQQAAAPPATPTSQPTAAAQQGSGNADSAAVQPRAPAPTAQPKQAGPNPTQSPSASGPTRRDSDDDDHEHEEEQEHEEEKEHEEHEDDD
jgi:hypothetical protein